MPVKEVFSPKKCSCPCTGSTEGISDCPKSTASFHTHLQHVRVRRAQPKPSEPLPQVSPELLPGEPCSVSGTHLTKNPSSSLTSQPGSSTKQNQTHELQLRLHLTHGKHEIPSVPLPQSLQTGFSKGAAIPHTLSELSAQEKREE